MIPEISSLIMTFFDSYVNAAMDETDENNMDALLALAKSSFKRNSKKFTNALKIVFKKAEDDILETLSRVGWQNSQTEAIRKKIFEDFPTTAEDIYSKCSTDFLTTIINFQKENPESSDQQLNTSFWFTHRENIKNKINKMSVPTVCSSMKPASRWQSSTKAWLSSGSAKRSTS